MITARQIGGARFVARLAAQARRLGEARAEARVRERRGDRAPLAARAAAVAAVREGALRWKANCARR